MAVVVVVVVVVGGKLRCACVDVRMCVVFGWISPGSNWEVKTYGRDGNGLRGKEESPGRFG